MWSEQNNVDGEERPSNDWASSDGGAADGGGCLRALAHRARISHTRSLMSRLSPKNWSRFASNESARREGRLYSYFNCTRQSHYVPVSDAYLMHERSTNLLHA
jgi:hypothetical protein